MTDEPLTWGVVANVSLDVFTHQETGVKRPGTRHFVPGAKVWVLPVSWGDGGQQRFVVGMRRGTGGRGLIRLVMNTDFFVNHRLKPVHSPAVHAAMGQPRDDGRTPRLYESRDEAQRSVDSAKWVRTRVNHLGLTDDPGLMHHADETCVFCDGRDAARGGSDVNPYPAVTEHAAGSVDFWGTDHGLWRCGWLTETHQRDPGRIGDLGVRHLALQRRRVRRSAGTLARTAVGRTVAELEADGIGRNRLRFVRGDYQPRLLDGVVHAWLDDENRVVRTQSG
ncbi:hypothetical protein [Actinoplanes couchii]|uniref:Uncharacterized protein n=1 Tax=Actinoplanes couchii TaxID=403638 RepID=A0ABQ3XKR4_9ACTN|nr:hypothetical protein [Actinoplanes couchii]MDR6319521.1 hypothetical protein [Actinoplanes couchii]GID59090.1 hypothetical protein Aco03nite_074940 [Actinoplanes couchii]